jgi:hypothetical protein
MSSWMFMDHIHRDLISRAALRRRNAGESSKEIDPQYEHIHVFPRIVQSKKIEDSESPPLPTATPTPKETQMDDVLDNVGSYWMN